MHPSFVKSLANMLMYVNNFVCGASILRLRWINMYLRGLKKWLLYSKVVLKAFIGSHYF